MVPFHTNITMFQSCLSHFALKWFSNNFLHQLTLLHQKAAQGNLKEVKSLTEKTNVNTADIQSGVSCESALLVVD